MSKEITKPERVMYYEGSKMSFLEYVDQLEAYAENLEKAINYTQCCEKFFCNDEKSKDGKCPEQCGVCSEYASR